MRANVHLEGYELYIFFLWVKSVSWRGGWWRAVPTGRSRVARGFAGLREREVKFGDGSVMWVQLEEDGFYYGWDDRLWLMEVAHDTVPTHIPRSVPHKAGEMASPQTAEMMFAGGTGRVAAVPRFAAMTTFAAL